MENRYTGMLYTKIVVTVYCDRFNPSAGKACKEQAAKIRYEEKIAAAEGRTLYQ